MAALLFEHLALVPERGQLVVEHAQRRGDRHVHVDLDRQPEPTRLQTGNRPQSPSPYQGSTLLNTLKHYTHCGVLCSVRTCSSSEILKVRDDSAGQS